MSRIIDISKDTGLRECEEAGDARDANESDSEIDPERAGDAGSGFISGYSSKRGDAPGQRHAQERVHILDPVDQFPLPPSDSLPGRVQQHRHRPWDSSSLNESGKHSSSQTATTTTADTKRGDSRSRDSFIIPPEAPAATFRQMPLLNTDLKNATVSVVGSNIRANDKGKEVLSFVVGISVVGKEGWVVRLAVFVQCCSVTDIPSFFKIEKFYSDVLALDARLKSRINRSLAKKLAPLPDNKLFKDHAPAKVDQRKVC